MADDEVSWTVAAAIIDESGGDQTLWMYTGVIGDGSTEPTTSGPAANYSGAIQQVVHGYWSPTQARPMFMFVDSTATLQVWGRRRRLCRAGPNAESG